MKGWVVALLVTIGVLLAIFATFFAQSAPTVPTAQLFTPLNAGASQSIVVTFTMGDYSVIAPNTVWGLGMHFTFTVVETTSLGNTYILANNATAAPSVGSSSGNFYQLTNTQTFNTVAACSGINCVGVTETVTITASGTVVTPFAAYQSAKSVTTFSNTNEGTCTTGLVCPPISQSPGGLAVPAVSTTAVLDSFLLVILVPLTILVAVEAFGVWGTMWKHVSLPIIGTVAIVLVAVEFLIL